MRDRLERYFEFAERRTSWRTETLAGVTTFATMAYIIFVNPSIPERNGDARGCGHGGDLPVRFVWIDPDGGPGELPAGAGAGHGAERVLHLHRGEGHGNPVANGAGRGVSSGIIFLLLTMGGIRQRLLAAIPGELHAAVGGGIGLFIAFIGLRNAGIVAPSAATTVTLGNLHAPATLLAIFGLGLIAVLQALRVRAAILLGVLGTLLLGISCGQMHWAPGTLNPLAMWHPIEATAFHLDLRGALRLHGLEIIFVFLFVDLFDNIGTLVAVTEGRA